MAFVLYLSLACAVPLLLCLQSLIPLLPLFSFQPCTRLRFSPNKLSRFQILCILILTFLKPYLKRLRLVPSLTPSRGKDSTVANDDAFNLPDVRLETPVVVSRADLERYKRATGVPNNASPTSGADSLFFLSPVTEPLMLLLLARPACPIVPLGSVNVRNRFEFRSPSECKQVCLRTRLRAEASLRRKGRRVKRGMEFDVMIQVFVEDTGDLIFNQLMTILHFLDEMVEPRWHESLQKEVVGVDAARESTYETVIEGKVILEEDAPLTWAALCKDYNPIHISSVAARLFGFPGKIAHGNQAAAMTIERLASTPRSLTRNLWLNSNRPSFMEVGFRRPMVVPLQLYVKVAPGATAHEPKEANQILTTAYNQIDVWADNAGLNSNVRHAAKRHFKRVSDSKAFEERRQDSILAGCIFIACREHNTPRTFLEIQAFTRVPKREIGLIYKSLERFLAGAHDETVQHFRLYGNDKVYVDGRIGWLGGR